jgi:2-phosphosulfolactate phosphatase
MHIDIQLLPYPPDLGILSNCSVVVVDVLRATSVIVHALARGALEIVPVETVEEAFEKSKVFSRGTVLLGGERQSRKIEGFDLGNSPREYLPEVVKGKRIILTTTNGTRAFHFVFDGKEVMAASFLNVDAAANRCVELRNDLLIFLSGDEGRFSLEDAVCGGMLIDRIYGKGKPCSLTDASLVAHVLFQRFESNLDEALQASSHGKDLMRLGLGDDLAYCAQTDLFPVVPVFRDGVIRLLQNAEG